MSNLAQLESHHRVFQALTGLTPKAFGQLLSAFGQAYEAALAVATGQRATPRQRQRGGRKATLQTLADKLGFILFYFKLYLTQDALGLFFGLSQGQACEWIHRLTLVLNQALGCEKQLPARQLADVTQVLAACPGLEFALMAANGPFSGPKIPHASLSGL
ncbi:MAG: transposase family protein [Chloroflexi bacterium]|nr:transposase family protein [Chloroflexota bacterium]